MTLLHLAERIDVLLDEGLRPIEIGRRLGPEIDAELALGVLPGRVGLFGEILDGPIAVVVVFLIAKGRKHRRQRQGTLPTT